MNHIGGYKLEASRCLNYDHLRERLGAALYSHATDSGMLSPGHWSRGIT